MISISDKKETQRRAVAEGKITMTPEVLRMVRTGRVPKGDVLKTAEIAALLAVKQTPLMIPHCHPVRITEGSVRFQFDTDGITATCEIGGRDRTGFEMEALHGVVVALLTVYDMCKGFGYALEIGTIRLIGKSGGKHIFPADGLPGGRIQGRNERR